MARAHSIIATYSNRGDMVSVAFLKVYIMLALLYVDSGAY